MAVELSKLNLNCHDCGDIDKLYRGCNGGGKLAFQYEGKAIDFCPVKLITTETKGYIMFYNWYKKNFLPMPGTIAQQPIKIMGAFDILESCEIEMAKKETHEMLR